MPDLPPITQEFVSDTAPYIAGLEEAIAVAREFTAATLDAAAAVEVLHAAIDALPDSRTIRIHVETTGLGADVAAAAAARGAGITETFGTEGAGGAAAANEAVAASAAHATRETLDLAAAEAAAAAAAMADAAAFRAGAGALDDHSAALADFIGHLGDATGAAERLFAVDAQGAATEIALTAAEKDHASAAARVALSVAALKAAQDSYTAGTDASVAGQLAAVKAARALAGAYTEVEKGARLATAAETALSQAAESGLLRTLLTGQVPTPAKASGGGRYGLGAHVPLFGGAFGSTAMIGSVTGLHIALDGVLEAAIAVGGSLIALTAGMYAMAPAAQDIRTHLQALNTVNEALGANIAPLTGKFAALQRAMAPMTVEAYGGALNLLGGDTSALSRTMAGIVTMFDDWIARIDIYMGSQGSMNHVLQAGAGYLRQFGTFFGEVGVAVGNLIKSDPGTVRFLLDLVDGFGRVLDVVTSIPAPILKAALAIHSFLLWGGLLGSALTRMVTSLASFGQGILRVAAQLGLLGRAGKAALIPVADLRTATDDAEKSAGGLNSKLIALAASPWAWAAAAAVAVGALAFEFTRTDSATKSFIASVNTSLNSLSASAAIPAISLDIGNLNTRIDQVPAHVQQAAQSFSAARGTFIGALGQLMTSVASDTFSVKTLGDAWHVVTTGFASGAADISHLHAAMAAGSDISAYKGAIVSLTKEQGNLFRETGDLMRQGHSYAQSLALMDLAGVKASDSFTLMQQKVANLINGYRNLGVQGGILSNSVNAVTFSSELQQSKISQLTGAWDTFFKTLTGGESGFVSFEQQMTGLNQAMTGTASLSVSNGLARISTSAAGAATATRGAAASMTGLNASSLQARSTFLQTAQAAQQEMDHLMTLNAASGRGAAGYRELTQASKDMVAQMLPAAQHSQALTTILYGLAQQGGYRGADSFKALSEWIGKTINPAKNLDGITTKLTVSAGNLAKDAMSLANAIGQTLNTAMAKAILQATGGQKAFDAFATAVVKNGSDINADRGAATHLASELLALTGNTRQAHNEFDVMATQLSLTKGQADRLWNSVSSLASAMYAIPNISRTITIQEKLLGSSYAGLGVNLSRGATGGIAGADGIIHAAGGAVLPGFAPGHDSILAMLSPGEGILTPDAVRMIGPGAVLALNRAAGRGSLAGSPLLATAAGAGDRLAYAAPSGGGTGYSGPSHLSVEVSGETLATVMMEDLVAESARWGIRNSGRVTGRLIPGS